MKGHDRKSHIEKQGERGITLLVGIVSLLFIIPSIGLVVDVGFLYATKARLQASVDGAALAAARALNVGTTTAAQTNAAQNNAVNWFNANFPAGSFGTLNTVMGPGNVVVFDDPNNPNVRNVTVTATTQVNTFFMRWLGFTTTNIGATGNAARRDVVVMMVLDRSGSMNSSGSCGALVSSAKLFVGQFANGRDRIGMVSFADNTYIHSAPTTNFQSVLGYTNDTGSGTGEIDSLVCGGGTNTSQAVSLAYNELYKTNLPGALNVLMFETDGLPNTLTLDFWDSANSVAGISGASNCKDNNGKAKGQSGFATKASLPSWTGGHTMGPNGYRGDIPAGIIGGLGVQDPGSSNASFILYSSWTSSKSNNFQEGTFGYVTSNSAAPGCGFLSSHNSTSDIAWIPTADVYGNNLVTSYKGVTTSGGHVTYSWANFRAAAFNAADQAAANARTNATLPVFVFGLGLGSTAAGVVPPDFVLMQRMANDPNPDNFNNPAQYHPCASESGCATYPDQPQGTFVFSTDKTVLTQAFLEISSQILRLSK